MALAGKSQKILIVDDEPEISEILHDSLSSKGYSVSVARDGQEALEVIKRDAVSVVVSDLKMPKMSGSVLLKKIKGSFPELPVIIITGHGTIDDAVEAMKRGASDYIMKPFHYIHIRNYVLNN